VQLAAVDAELGDHAEHQLGQQRRAVGVEEIVQRAADAIVVEQRGLAVSQAQQRRVVARCPVGQAVERLARDAQVCDQHADHGRGRQRDAGVAGRQAAVKHARHAGACNERVHDRQRPELLGAKLKRLRRVREIVGHQVPFRPVPTIEVQ
jgi:hypothetical protein